MPHPVIGITLDHETTPTYAAYPWYALRENYAQAIQEVGGVPLFLPYADPHIDQYLDMLDGLVLSGGDSDVNPTLYGCQDHHPLVILKENRTHFEMALVKEALNRDLPILGICRGVQLLNVALGGTLHQHLPDDVPGCLAHKQKQPNHQPSHAIHITPGTRLFDLLGVDSIDVNSTHHQAVDKTSPHATVNAKAPDGIIEGIEVLEHRFCLGVQWHPEYLETPWDWKIFKAFMEAARQ